MKIGILSDTHLRKVTRELRDLYARHLSDVDVILHAGDFVSPAIISFLSQKDFYGVWGNMDPPEIRSMLPEIMRLDLGGYRIGLIHGWGAPEGIEDRVRGAFFDRDVIVYGHSHRAANHMRGGVLFFNPGSACGYTSAGFHSVGILTIDDGIRGEIIDID